MQSHSHAPASFGRAFAIGVLLNLGFVLVEAYYGWQTGSLALLADAGHNLSDVAGLLLAWAAFGAANLKANSKHSYGWRKGSIIASFINAVILLVAMGALSWEALGRITTPTGVDGMTVIIVAAIGMVINTLTAWLFMRGSQNDLNIRGAFLHMAADALVSAGVVVAGILYLWKGWSWLDPVVSLLIALIIVISTWSLFRRSLHLLFDGVPDNIDLNSVESSLNTVSGVCSVHDLHIWAISTSENALTAHLVVTSDQDHNHILYQAGELLKHQFELHHFTLQLESLEYAKNCESELCASISSQSPSRQG
ncbi:cation diffusion facilitator family transporter [Nitrincola sp. A-D6]|uniref:cation diffusion facilitator family transporter n=1 Tax=Nitrincola sp. A-D6 TaxID=1545442 RepID=UPI00228683A3|nr:cation diffusion facilitator family transporter [Nitrincola sp. A-D6]